MPDSTVETISPSVQVKAWQRHPGTVLQIEIGRTLTLEEMERIAWLTRSTVRLLLKVYSVGDDA